ncbi:methyl-accepting chemotaxis protein [Evansella caseinilytica]|uniref:Methyl-accepting chemotaxis protein n=1 Tax=Evansella caseinilytica TaxID=1503961 RepID=A0A1H3U4B2_9BACI|nr:methyl-accepting chemotaxis protein [Evansella caseinilytica]SDZ57168.1 methyl-accepting chemotaxis protein [Evansella caseinilytica]
MSRKNYSFKARNWLLIKLYLLSVVLTAVILFAGGLPLITNLIGTAFGVFTVILVFVMYKWDKKENWIPYILIVSLATMTVFMLVNRPAITTYLLVYYSIIIMSLYHNYRYVLVSGVFGLIITNFFALTYGEQTIVDYSGVYLASLNILFVLKTTFLIAQSVIGKNMQKDAEVLAQEAVASKEQMENVMDQVRLTVTKLEELNGQLTSHSKSTASYSNELSVTFGEIAGGVESQAQSATEMSESFRSIDREVGIISTRANTMKENAGNTGGIVLQGAERVEQLNNTIHEVDQTLQKTVEEMEELNNATSKVGDILQTISEIADQTNLLALNAAIEAARAGESGKGFAVVAQEVRQLAEHSIRSTEEISQILTLIQQKVNSATTRVKESESTFKAGKQLTEETGDAFSNIQAFVEELQELSTDINEKVESLTKSSTAVVDEVNSVSGVTEELNASVEEVLASIEEQNEKIAYLNDKVNEMNQLAEQLQHFVSNG